MAKVLIDATDSSGKVDTSKLSTYKASVAYDLWSFGVVLFHLVFGRPLWLTDQNDNVTIDDLKTLAGVSSGAPFQKVLKKALYAGGRREASIDLKTAAALLRKLLEPDEAKRLEYFEATDTPMQAMLDEPFFRSERLDASTLERIEEKVVSIEKNTVTLVHMGEEHRSELRRTRDVLLKGIFEATEVSTPTVFIVLKEELPSKEDEQQMLTLELKEDGSGFEGGGELITLAEKRFEEGKTWLDRLKTFGEGVSNAVRQRCLTRSRARWVI
jgi:serine/threonine protein kinase